MLLPGQKRAFSKTVKSKNSHCRSPTQKTYSPPDNMMFCCISISFVTYVFKPTAIIKLLRHNCHCPVKNTIIVFYNTVELFLKNNID